MLTDRTTIYDWAHGNQSAVLIAACTQCGAEQRFLADDYLRGTNPPYDIAALKSRLFCKQCNCTELVYRTETNITSRN